MTRTSRKARAAIRLGNLVEQGDFGEWSDLIEKDLSIEFIDGYRTLIRVKQITNDLLSGAKLALSSNNMRLEENGTSMIFHKKYIRKVSLIEVAIKECGITVPCTGALVGSQEKPVVP
jgi:hypothetical protein